jgi:Domain of unknown function (DUF1963)
MLRFLLLLLFVVLVIASAAIVGLGYVLQRFAGWKGLLGLPVILYALFRLVKPVFKIVGKRLALGLFSGKSRVLRGATMTVQSVVSVAAPEKSSDELEDAEDSKGSDDDENEAETSEEEEPKHYYTTDITITPRDPGSRELWEPGELILTSQKISTLEELRENEVGIADEVLVWKGAGFGPDDPGKYEGTRRLKVTFAVKPGTSKVWLCYYNEAIGSLELPPWTSAEEPPRKRLTQRTARASRDSIVRQSSAQREAAKQARRGTDFKTGAGQPQPEVKLYEPPDESIDADLSMAEMHSELERIGARKLDALPLGGSRFGGVPDLPPDLPWPEFRERKLPFLAQIDLSVMPKSVLPPDGWLFAFGLCDNHHTPTPIRVLYHQGPRDKLIRAARPAVREIWEDWEGNGTYDVVPLNATKEKDWKDCGQLLGEIDEEGEDAASVADSQDCSGDDWVTLMIIPSVGSMMWSDCGLFHIVIRSEDLARHDFTKVCAGLSCVG